MYRLTQAQPGQMPEILAFAERAFAAQEKDPDFARMLPKLYGRGRATESEHTLLYNGDVLEGMYALRVLDAKAAGEPLRVGWIGTVAVRREARGKGHLERLMQHANRRLETLGCDLGVLGGQRQRYQRFGYDCAGTQWEFCLDARSLRDVPARGLALREIGRASPDLARAEAQYRRGTICCHRAPEDFYDVLCSWDARPWAFYRGAEYAGYCTVQQSGGCAVIWEFCPLRAEDAPAACKAVMQRLQCGALRVSLPPWAGGAQQALADAAARTRLAENHSYRVLRWERVLRAAMAVRSAVGPPLCPGALRFSVRGGPDLEIFSGPDGAGVRTLSRGAPGLRLSANEAVRLVLGPDSALVRGAAGAPPGWLPFPLAFSWQDGI